MKARWRRRWRKFDEELQSLFAPYWQDLIKYHRVLRTDRWGKNACWLSQAANEIRRMETWWLKDAGASGQIRKESSAFLKRRHLEMLHCIIGNPFRPYTAQCWPSEIVALAKAMYQGDDCAGPLHDALLEAGHPDLAEHLSASEGMASQGGIAPQGLLGSGPDPRQVLTPSRMPFPPPKEPASTESQLYQASLFKENVTAPIGYSKHFGHKITKPPALRVWTF